MNWFRQLFFRRRRYDDIYVSIQEHLDERIDELISHCQQPVWGVAHI